MPVLFAFTLFNSALLLFLVQPMVATMIQPLIGGGPAVWNTCMVFYQALLLGGYWYAHKLASLPSQRSQVLIHLGVQLAAVVVMLSAVVLTSDHLAVPVLKSLAPRGSVFPFIWVIAMLAVAIGIPFFAVSASAPLLQRWFTATGHPSSKDPYFLYAASNAGSLISLLCYPVLIEPSLSLTQQTWLFAGGFVALFGLTLLCGRASLNPVRPPSAGNTSTAAPDAPEPSRWRKAKWVALAFVPSSLMLGLTSKMTTDVASVPLLWIIPLTLYLLTFIVAFSKMPSWFRLALANLTPVVTLLLIFVETSGVGLSQVAQALLYTGNFFLMSLLMHGELAHDRPDPRHLTNYFLWISFGGVLGGLFNSLFAPLLFTHLYEYHIAIVVGCLLLPKTSTDIGAADESETKPVTAEKPKTVATEPDSSRLLERVLDVLIPLSMVAVAGWLVWAENKTAFKQVCIWTSDALTQLLSFCGLGMAISPTTVSQFAVYAPPCMLCFLFIDRPLRFGLCVLAVVGMHHFREATQAGDHTTFRSFFGLVKINRTEDEHEYEYMPAPKWEPTDAKTDKKPSVTISPDATLRSMSHGTTLHGKQYADRFDMPMLRDQVRVFGAMNGWESVVLAGGPQSWDQSHDPLTYYHRTGPVGDIFRESFRRKPQPRVGMVGLGTGSVAAYATPGQKMTFFELDRTVRDMIEGGDELDSGFLARLDRKRKTLAQKIDADQKEGKEPSGLAKAALTLAEELLADPVREILNRGGKIDTLLADVERKGIRLSSEARRAVSAAGRSFTYVTDARKRGAAVDIVLGDARLTLEEQPAGEYDLLLIDAFSSDSIPTHLLTLEAVRMYWQKIGPNGLLALHVSNRYLRLEPVVRAIADDLGMVCRLYADNDAASPGKTQSSWIVMARTEAELGEAFVNPPPPAGTQVTPGEPIPVTWRPIPRHDKIPAWTDDFKDVLKVNRFPALQAVRGSVGLSNLVPEWEAMMDEIEKEYGARRR